MCRFKEAELYCVRTKILMTSELMQFEIGISTRRYLPPRGTAGFDLCSVRGERRDPAPPPRITASRLRLTAMPLFSAMILNVLNCLAENRRKTYLFQGNSCNFLSRQRQPNILQGCL